MEVIELPTIGSKRPIKQDEERSKLLIIKLGTFYLITLQKMDEIPDLVLLLKLNDLLVLPSPSPSTKSHKNPLKTSSFSPRSSQYDLGFQGG